MKKILIALASAALLLSGCETYDDSAINDKLDQLAERIAALEKQVNDNAQALAVIAEAGTTSTKIVTSYKPTDDGKGWVITFSDGTSITLNNGSTGEPGDPGKPGENGQPGKPGEDGLPGQTPAVGLIEIDGVLCWTVNGEPATDADGNYIPAQGSNAVIPQIKIEDGKWYVSYNGTTWTEIPVSGTTPEGTIDITEDEDSIILDFGNGTVIKLAKGWALKITASEEISIAPGKSAEISYTINGADETTHVEAEASEGYKTAVNEADSKVTVTAPADVAEGDYVIIKAVRNSDSAYSEFLVSLVKAKVELEGAGTEASPYLIKTVEDLDAMRYYKEAQDTLTTAYYKLANDLDMSEADAWTPIDTRNAAYIINFDGDNHIIRNFTCTSDRYPSLFGLVCGTVKNVTFRDCVVSTSSKTPVGIVAAWVGNNGGTLPACTLENVHVIGGSVTTTAAGAASTGIGAISGCAGKATFKNCTVTNCTVNNKSNSSNADGNIESWCGGLVGGTYAVDFEGCTFTGDVIAVNSNRNTGGLVGKAMSLSVDGNKVFTNFKNCSFDGNVSSESDLVGGLVAWCGGGIIEGCSFKGSVSAWGAKRSTSATAYAYCGGIAGYVTSSVTLDIRKCSVSGTLTSKGKVLGGILGQNSCNTTITECTVDAPISGGQFVGGVTGYDQQGNFTITKCTVKADVKGVDSICGGILGQSQAGNVTISDCSHEGSVSSAKTYNAGIIGNTNTAARADVARCCHSGDISGTDYSSGIVGLAKAPGSIIDCYSTGGRVKGGQFGAGIASDCGATMTIQNCWSDMDLVTNYGMGCIAGRMTNLVNPNSTSTWQSEYASILKGCIAWGSINSAKEDGQSPASGYSSGAVLGCTVFKNTLENCWRKPNMSFRAYPSDLASYNTPVDQENSSAASPYVKLGEETFYMPYHGKAAATGETVSAVAKRIGWDETVWDLSGEYPRLK